MNDDIGVLQFFFTKFCQPRDVDNMELRPHLELLLGVVEEVGGDGLCGGETRGYYEDEDPVIIIGCRDIIRGG